MQVGLVGHRGRVQLGARTALSSSDTLPSDSTSLRCTSSGGSGAAVPGAAALDGTAVTVVASGEDEPDDLQAATTTPVVSLSMRSPSPTAAATVSGEWCRRSGSSGKSAMR